MSELKRHSKSHPSSLPPFLSLFLNTYRFRHKRVKAWREGGSDEGRKGKRDVSNVIKSKNKNKRFHSTPKTLPSLPPSFTPSLPQNSPLVGSSKNKIAGFDNNSVATATRFLSPPEIPRIKLLLPPIKASAHPCSPTSSKIASTLSFLI